MRQISLLLLLLASYLSGYSQEQKEEIRNIYFGGGSYRIDGEQINDLNEFVKKLKNIEYYDVTIIGHTDDIGGKDYNQWLSQMRNAAVIQQLKQMGLPSEIIRFRSDGQENPAFKNDSMMNRMRNRRVDIIFTPIVF